MILVSVSITKVAIDAEEKKRKIGREESNPNPENPIDPNPCYREPVHNHRKSNRSQNPISNFCSPNPKQKDMLKMQR